MATTSKLRIDFQVREVLADGAVGEPRYVTFGDDVDMGAIKDFFERCGIACDLMFQGYKSPKLFSLDSSFSGSSQKIMMIKLVRELTGCGLKEAKDIVEAPPGTPIVVFKDGRDADAVMKRLQRDAYRLGEHIVVRDADFGAIRDSGTLEYIRPPRV